MITDLVTSDVSCSSLGAEGSSDHYTKQSSMRGETIRQWEKAEWQSVYDALFEAPWEDNPHWHCWPTSNHSYESPCQTTVNISTQQDIQVKIYRPAVVWLLLQNSSCPKDE